MKATITGITNNGKPIAFEATITSIESPSGEYREKWKDGTIVQVYYNPHWKATCRICDQSLVSETRKGLESVAKLHFKEKHGA
jgi:hypothetical protein